MDKKLQLLALLQSAHALTEEIQKDGDNTILPAKKSIRTAVGSIDPKAVMKLSGSSMTNSKAKFGTTPPDRKPGLGNLKSPVVGKAPIKENPKAKFASNDDNSGQSGVLAGIEDSEGVKKHPQSGLISTLANMTKVDIIKKYNPEQLKAIAKGLDIKVHHSTKDPVKIVEKLIEGMKEIAGVVEPSTNDDEDTKPNTSEDAGTKVSEGQEEE